MLVRENVPEGRKLDPKIKIRWFLEKMPIILPLVASMAVLLYAIYYQQGELNPVYPLICILVIGALVASTYSVVDLTYRKFVYALREKDFLIQKGIVEKIRYIIPYEKIQNVTVSRDFLDVALGLGTLHIETAAHVYLEHDILLPGVSNDDNLVREIVERSRLAKKEDSPYPKSEDVVDVMKNVLAELKEIKWILKEEPEKNNQKEIEPLTHKEAKREDPISEQLQRTRVLLDKSTKKRRGTNE